MPAIDFDQSGSIDIPVPPSRGSSIHPPEIEINRQYNPFQQENYSGYRPDSDRNADLSQWEKLYRGLERPDEGTRGREDEEGFVDNQSGFPFEEEQTSQTSGFLQLKNRYLLTPVKSGLMVIDQREAHARILYEEFMHNFSAHLSVSQRQLFPPVLQLNHLFAAMSH